MTSPVYFLVLLSLTASAMMAGDLPSLVNGQLPDLVEIYKGIHEHPELSRQEAQTSAKLAAELRKAGYTVTEHVGKYPDGLQADGVVAILKNGDGPELLIRADMDALPIVENTGVDYASQVNGVMHACGHDIHTTTLIGVGRALAGLKSEWHGTLMLIGQPAEEAIKGARAMLADGLYERFGTPTYAIALHDASSRPAGTVGLTTGPATTSATSIDVTIRGVGGHGAFPQVTKDPIVMSAEFIMQLQTIVSRQEDPSNPSILTVGDIHGGTRRNIIPNEVKMELTARTFSEQAREIILDGVRRTAKGVAIAAGVPEDRMPVVTVLENDSCPSLYNDPELMTKVKAALVEAIGARNVGTDPPIMASEDFPFFGLDRKIPTVMFWLGAANPAKYAAAQAAGTMLPGPHTDKFQPDPEPTLRTGVTGMTSVAIALLQK